MDLNFDKAKEYDYEIIHPKYPEVKFFCRSIQVSKESQLLRKHSGKKTNRKEEFADVDGFSFDRFNYIVVDWEGLTEKGESFPCNEQNKRKFYGDFSKTLVKYISDEVDYLMNVDAGLEEGN